MNLFTRFQRKAMQTSGGQLLLELVDGGPARAARLQIKLDSPINAADGYKLANL